MDNGDKPPKQLNQEDQAHWDEFTGKNKADVEEKSFEELLDSQSSIKPDEERQNKSPGFKKVEADKIVASKQSSEIDKRTEEKIRKGKMPIDAKLDLHGLSQTQAHKALKTFIQQSAQQQKRCLLVVTGKGKAKSTSDDWISPGQGVLKQKVPQWLQADIFKDYILNFYTAQPQHGGSGALYIYLRRQR